MSRKPETARMVKQNTTRNRVRGCLKSQRGESLSETLVGLLIAGLSVVMFTMAIATAARVIEKTYYMAGVYSGSTKDLTASPTALDDDSQVEVTGSGAFAGISEDVDVFWEEGELPGERTGITYRKK